MTEIAPDPQPACLPIWPSFGLIGRQAGCLGAMNLLGVLASAPLIAVQFDLSAVQIGLIASAYSAALGLMSIPSGRLADAIGVRVSLAAAAAVIALGMLLVATGQGFGLILGGMVLVGVGYSLVNPAAGRAVLLWYPPTLRGTLMGIKQTGVPVGAVIGTGSATLGPWLGWQWVVGALAGVTALCALLFLCLPADGNDQRVPRASLREELAAIGRLFSDPVLARNNLASGLNNGGQFTLWAYLIEFLRLGLVERQGPGWGFAACVVDARGAGVGWLCRHGADAAVGADDAGGRSDRLQPAGDQYRRRHRPARLWPGAGMERRFHAGLDDRRSRSGTGVRDAVGRSAQGPCALSITGPDRHSVLLGMATKHGKRLKTATPTRVPSPAPESVQIVPNIGSCQTADCRR